MKWLVLFVVLFALWISSPALAQDFASIRPAKGDAFTIFSGVALASATSTTSEAYDWTAFSAVQIILASSAACAFKPVVAVLGAANVEGSPIDFAVQTNENGTYTYDDTGSTTAHYVVGNTLPWIKFRLTATAGTGSASCTVTVVVVPVPFDPSVTGTTTVSTIGTATSALEQDTRNASISSASASTLITAASTGSRRLFWAQNQGTVDLCCILGTGATCTTDGVVTLKGGLAANDGEGGFWSASDWAGAVSCIAASGTGSAAAGAY